MYRKKAYVQTPCHIIKTWHWETLQHNSSVIEKHSSSTLSWCKVSYTIQWATNLAEEPSKCFHKSALPSCSRTFWLCKWQLTSICLRRSCVLVHCVWRWSTSLWASRICNKQNQVTNITAASGWRRKSQKTGKCIDLWVWHTNAKRWKLLTEVCLQAHVSKGR